MTTMTVNTEKNVPGSGSSDRSKIYRLVAIGFMSALVYIGNYMQIKIGAGDGATRIHLGNSMCLLAALLFGGVSGGLSSGIGGALFDLFDPVYITSAPYTFFSKFALGFTAGALRRLGKESKLKTILAAVAGQIVYIILYLGKTFVSQLLIGEPVNVALASVGVKAAASSINGALAVLIAVPLYYAISAALKHTGFGALIGHKSETV